MTPQRIQVEAVLNKASDIQVVVYRGRHYKCSEMSDEEIGELLRELSTQEKV